jgi:hypothetical protein
MQLHYRQIFAFVGVAARVATVRWLRVLSQGLRIQPDPEESCAAGTDPGASFDGTPGTWGTAFFQ